MPRKIETFEPSCYFLQSWLNGNKTHVKEELAELYECSPYNAIKVLLSMPSEIAEDILDSNQFCDVLRKRL